MSLQELIQNGGTFIFDPAETTEPADELLSLYGNYIDSICLVAKSEVGSTYFQSSTAPKDPRYGDTFFSFAQIANDIGIRVYALVHGNMDGFFSRDPNFQMYHSNSSPIDGYVCPNQEVYWQYLSEIAAEIAVKIDLDGILLKDVNYPRDIACFCDNCRRNFASSNNIDRDFSLEQLKKRANLFAKWQDFRTAGLRNTISTVVNRVYKEKKIDILSELLLDPQTNYLEGTSTYFGQDINTMTQVAPHLLLHIHPWSPLPATKPELAKLQTALEPLAGKLRSGKNSLFAWDVTPESFNLLLELKDALGSDQLFFTNYQPSSYLNRRSLHLNLSM